MPLTRKQHHQSSFAHLLLWRGLRRDHPPPFSNIDQLVLAQNPSFLRIEKITGRMILQRIRRIRLDRLKAHSIYPKTIFLVHVIYNKVLKLYS